MNDESEVAGAVSDVEDIDRIALGGLVFFGVLVTSESERDRMPGGVSRDEVGLAAGEQRERAGLDENLAFVLVAWTAVVLDCWADAVVCVVEAAGLVCCGRAGRANEATEPERRTAVVRRSSSRFPPAAGSGPCPDVAAF